MSPEQKSAASRRSLALLGLGAAAGLALAVMGVLGDGPADPGFLPEDAVARVNQKVIRRTDFDRLVSGLENDTRRPANQAARRLVLDRLIDEELLVQHALSLGLAEVDRKVRAGLTSALIASVVAEADGADPSRGELEDFYAREGKFFTLPGRLRVRQILFRDADGGSGRADEARRRILAGESFESIRSSLGDPEISPLPDAPLPALKLREYIGPTALRSVLELEVGELSPVVRSGTGLHLFHVIEREEASLRPLQEIEAQVRAEWRRRAGDRALRSYLDDLRSRAEIVTPQDFAE